jgi:replication-associated recombination protein RarA
MDEVASALQKCIRRGLEEEALYWALELESEYMLYVWKRLAVTAAEDIGMANPMASVLVNSLWQSYEMIRKNSATKSVDENVLAFAVLYLCRSPKNREVDDFKNVVYEERKDQQRLNGEPQNPVTREIPDFALDMHTDRGRSMKRGLTHWWEEGIEIANEVGGSLYRRRAGKLLTGKDYRRPTTS